MGNRMNVSAIKDNFKLRVIFENALKIIYIGLWGIKVSVILKNFHIIITSSVNHSFLQ